MGNFDLPTRQVRGEGCGCVDALHRRAVPPQHHAGLGFGVWGLGFRVWGLGLEVWGVGLRVWGLGCMVWGLPLALDVLFRERGPVRARAHHRACLSVEC